MRVGMILWLTLTSQALRSQPAYSRSLTGIWWSDCEHDVRYERAYGHDLTFGKKDSTGGWKIAEVSRLAESGDACMQNFLGRYYHPPPVIITDVENPISEKGLGLPGDDREWRERFLLRARQAAKWFRLAAEQGHGESQGLLADMYWKGIGTRQDYVEAMRWYKKAADQGLSCDQLQLGDMYRDSKGVTRNYVQAHMWMNLAATNELDIGLDCSEMAQRERDALAFRMTPDQLDEAHRFAREWKPKISQDPIKLRKYKE